MDVHATEPPRPMTRPDDLARSYSYCRRLARREAGNFFHAFRILPADQMRAMCALYAFMRLSDDVADEPGPVETKRARLREWRRQFEDSLTGRCHHRVFPAFRDTMDRFAIPRTYIDEVLDGVEQDLSIARYERFGDLYRYCYRVASAVGFCCISIWGYEGERALEFAESAGIAFQLTNILRDVAEDLGRDRIYLPREDLIRFGYDEDQLRAGQCDPPFRELMRFEVDRARQFYDDSLPLTDCLSPSGRAVFSVMWRTYRALLEEIERVEYDVFSQRVRVSTWRKLWFALGSLPIRFGWA